MPSMFYGAKPDIFKRARQLRAKMTEAEIKLWQHLNKNQLGVRFKPQHPTSSFVLDFYCHALLFAIEIDGPIHNFQKEYDQLRTDEINKFGINIIRFTNDEILNDLESVLQKIKDEISTQKSRFHSN